MDLKNKKVLVTGASSGIGQAVAIAFAKKGATVLINYRSNDKGAEQTLGEVDKHSKGYVYKADFEQRDEVKSLFEQVLKDVGSIDVLVNNAGDAESGDIFDEGIWQKQYNNIFMTAVHASQEFLRVKASSQRKIINISSIYGALSTGNPEYLQYSAAKAAMNSLTMNLAKELGNKVLVNAVAPGYTWTPPWETTTPVEKKRYADSTLTKRFVDPDEIAHAVILLAENDAITGQILTVDGGFSLKEMNRHD